MERHIKKILIFVKKWEFKKLQCGQNILDWPLGKVIFTAGQGGNGVQKGGRAQIKRQRDTT